MLCRTVFFHVSLRYCVYAAGRFWQHFPQSTRVGSIDYSRLNLHPNVQKIQGRPLPTCFLKCVVCFQALVNTAGACKIRSFGLQRMKLVNHGAIHTRIKVGQGKSISDVWDDVYVSFHPRETKEPLYSRLTWRDKPWGDKNKISAFWFHGTEVQLPIAFDVLLWRWVSCNESNAGESLVNLTAFLGGKLLWRLVGWSMWSPASSECKLEEGVLHQIGALHASRNGGGVVFQSILRREGQQCPRHWPQKQYHGPCTEIWFASQKRCKYLGAFFGDNPRV